MAGTEFIERPTANPTRASLDQLAATVKQEHDACTAAMKTTVDHAIRAGEALLAARDLTSPTGEWTDWLAANCSMGRTQVYAYMRLAMHREVIPPGLGVAAADSLVKGLRAVDGIDRRRIGDARKEDARRWRKEGVGYKEIAKRLGVSVATVHNWFNGTKKGRDKKARAALKRQEQQQRIKRAVAKADEALKEAYAMAERLDDVLGQAHREATKPEARSDLARAHEFQRAMRDSIVSALGVES